MTNTAKSLGWIPVIVMIVTLAPSAWAERNSMAGTPWDRKDTKGVLRNYKQASRVHQKTSPWGRARQLYGQVQVTGVSKTGIPRVYFKPKQEAQGQYGYGAAGPNGLPGYYQGPVIGKRQKVRVVSGRDLARGSITVRPGKILALPVTVTDAFVLQNNQSIRTQTGTGLRYIGQTGRLIEEHDMDVALICMEELDEPLARQVMARLPDSDRVRLYSACEFNASQMQGVLKGLDLLVTEDLRKLKGNMSRSWILMITGPTHS